MVADYSSIHSSMHFARRRSNRSGTQRHKMTVFQSGAGPIKFTCTLDELQYLVTGADRGHQAAADRHLVQ
jgi:hypothetical protein